METREKKYIYYAINKRKGKQIKGNIRKRRNTM